MKKICATIILFSMAASFSNAAEKICSPINFCQVKKETYGKKGWKNEYIKTLDIPEFCDFDRPVLQVEPELGIELNIFKGDAKAETLLKKEARVVVNLFTYKLTYSVASGTGLANATAIAFSHRLTPKSPTLIEIECYKK